MVESFLQTAGFTISGVDVAAELKAIVGRRIAFAGHASHSVPAVFAGSVVDRPVVRGEVRKAMAGGSVDKGLVALSGMGGTGKTTEAIVAAHEMMEQEKFGVVWWMSAASRDSAGKGWRVLAEDLGVKMDDKIPIEDVIKHPGSRAACSTSAFELFLLRRARVRGPRASSPDPRRQA